MSDFDDARPLQPGHGTWDELGVPRAEDDEAGTAEPRAYAVRPYERASHPVGLLAGPVQKGAVPKGAPPAGDRRARIRARVAWLKKAAAVGTAVAFAGIWGLVANHTVGVTAHGTGSSSPSSSSPSQSIAPPAAQSPDSGGGFFGDPNGNSGAIGQGGGNSSGPVLGSGGS